MTTEKKVLSRIEEKGWRARIVPACHMKELKEEIDDYYARGLVDREPYEEYFSKLASGPPEDFANPSSMIIIATPQHYCETYFSVDGRRVPVIIPANYLSFAEHVQEVENALGAIVSEYGYSARRMRIPLKLFAVRSGLAEYGRNNIAYVPGMGSFHGLVGFVSDLPCAADSWRQETMMQACEKCSACRAACPTGAITQERFTIHAGRCIPFHNERSSDIPFPAWLDPRVQDSLVGCMHCQKVCPANKTFIAQKISGPSFDSEETRALLATMTPDNLPTPLVDKLKQSGMIDLLDVIQRNLPSLLEVGARSRR